MKLSGTSERLTYQSVFYRALVTRRVRSQSGTQVPGTFILNPIVTEMVMADTAKTTPTIAPPVSAQANETKPAAVAVVADKTPIVPEFTLVDVTTKLRKETRTGNMVDCLLIAHSDAQDVIAQVFDAQDSFENPSKFSRAFLWDAIIAQAKIQCNTAVNDYVRLLDKAARLKPRMTREAVEAELLESRRARAVKERSDKALALKAKL